MSDPKDQEQVLVTRLLLKELARKHVAHGMLEPLIWDIDALEPTKPEPHTLAALTEEEFDRFCDFIKEKFGQKYVDKIGGEGWINVVIELLSSVSQPKAVSKTLSKVEESAAEGDVVSRNSLRKALLEVYDEKFVDLLWAVIGKFPSVLPVETRSESFLRQDKSLVPRDDEEIRRAIKILSTKYSSKRGVGETIAMAEYCLGKDNYLAKLFSAPDPAGKPKEETGETR